MKIGKKKDSRITICTVSYYNADHLKLNVRLSNELNSKMFPEWVIVENTPDKKSDLYNTLLKNTHVLEGRPKSEFETPNEHHAAGLMRALETADTRFVLITDPDFFILYENWIETITNYMDSHGLSFFGVPWHPKWHIKYRYFPCIHCLFIDLSKVSKEEINFMPDFSQGNPLNNDTGSGRVLINRMLGALPDQAINTIKILKSLTVDRQKIGWDGDTGAKFYQRFSRNKKWQYECPCPVYNPEKELSASVPYKINKLIERFLPDRWCYVPKGKKYYQKTGLLGNISSRYQWEEFIWNGKVFGFHVRGYPKRKNRNLSSEISDIDLLLNKITKPLSFKG